MAETPIPPNAESSRAPKPRESRLSSFFVAVGITAGIAILIPITQAISAQVDRVTQRVDQVLNPPPPAPPPAPPPPPEQEQQEEEPELQEQRQPPTLEQLELALNPSLQGIGGDISIPTFDVADDLDSIIYDIGDVDERPEILFPVQPIHPPDLKRRGRGGEVILIAVIDQDGNVRNVTIESSTNQLFEPPTLSAFRKWKFRPARKGGEPVNVRIRIPITFPGRR